MIENINIYLWLIHQWECFI